MTHPPPSTRSEDPAVQAQTFAGDLSFLPLLACLEQQRDLYAKLLALSERMGEWIQAQRGEALPGLMDEREKAIDELRQIDVRLQGYRLHWIEWFPRLTRDQRERITQLAGALEQLRDQVRERDQAQAIRARGERDRLGRELGMLGQANRAAQSYRGQQGSSMLPGTDRQG